MSFLAGIFGRRRDPRDDLVPLWRAVVAAARQPEWYAECGVADSEEGRFDMLSAIMAAVIVRMERDGQLHPQTALLTELFVEDIEAQLRQLHYTSVPQIVTSDHTPVVSSFSLSLACPRLESRAQLIPGLRLLLSHLRAEDLMPHDANGLADPYVEVRHVPGPCAHYHPTLAPLWP